MLRDAIRRGMRGDSSFRFPQMGTWSRLFRAEVIEMSKALESLLESARRAQMTSEEREEQRRSFAYGNTKIENDRITKATIEQAAQELASEEKSE